ncbi:MAG: APC family permease [Anaerolineales bacterium]|nr:APC family permease [Anaerolineales bacterium]
MSEVTLFVRKASGLVRAWSVFDAFIYATFSINLITLGLYIFSFSWYFEGNLATAVVVGGLLTLFQIVVYASLISLMPRAGGDYIWQSRILGRGIGFILAVTGWWFILWLWVPLYSEMLTFQFFTPVFGILGATDTALWFTTNNGLMVASIIMLLLVSFYIAIGMKWYARVQKICFLGGMVGLGLVFAILLFGNQQTFIANLDRFAFGAEAGNLYQATLDAGAAAGVGVAPLGTLAFGASLSLIPLIVFFNLWPNWGATLYGEVRGAGDYKRNFWGMAMAALVTMTLAVIFFLLIAKTLGWDFYNSANAAFWNYGWGYTTEAPPLPFWPYPVLFAAFLLNSPALQLIVVILMSLWWFGWSGTVFLSSTRVIFAAAFDRMLPEWAASVEPRTRTPIAALLLMVIPSFIVATLYSYDIFDFQTLVLDATLVIAVTFFGTAIAAVVLPWRQKDLFKASAIAKYRVATWLGQVMVVVFAAGAVYLIVTSFRYAWDVLTGIEAYIEPTTMTWLIVIVVTVLTVINAVLLLWLLYYVGSRVFSGDRMPLITLAGLVFVLFLNWLLVEWFWDPNLLYGIGWINVSSMVFMLVNYGLAAAIYFGFTIYRRRQGIDVSKVYQEIPVE